MFLYSTWQKAGEEPGNEANSAFPISLCMAVSLSFLQLVKISVRTVTEEGESPDPLKLVVLNPRKLKVVALAGSGLRNA